MVINEVAWMGTAASSADEWIELYNTTSQDIDLTGWTLESTTDGTPSLTFDTAHCSNLVIPAGGFFLLERTDDNTVSDIPADCIYTGSLVNSGESLALKDPSGTVIDTANGDGGAWPAGDNTTKSTMERIDPLAPDSDANWATNNGVIRNGLDANGDPINGTPKAQNSTINQPPTCNDITITTDEDTPVDIDLTAYCSDPDGDPLTGSFLSNPANGTARFLSPTVRYTPDPNFFGTDSFQFRVSDGQVESNTATVNLTVHPVNDPPTASAVCSPLTLDEGETVTCDGSGSTDVDGDPLTFRWDFGDGGTGSGPTASHTYSDNGPPPDFARVITLTVDDGRGGSDTATVQVTVRNVPPTVEAGPDRTADVGQAISFQGSFTDPGPADTHTIAWDFGDGTTTTGTLTPTHRYSAAGVYTVTLTVTDDDGGVGQDQLTVTVNAPGLVAAKRDRDPNGPPLLVGDELEYEVVIQNEGTAIQPDNPGDEFEDPIPAGTSFVPGSLSASSGVVRFDAEGGKVLWNGSLAPGETVTIRFRVRVERVPTGTVIANQGTVRFDADGDGSNESTRFTDDPDTPEREDPTRSAPVILRGDPNGDGVIDLRDAILCAEGALALRTLSELEETACDVAPPPGVIDGRDVVRVAEIALGIASISKADPAETSIPEGAAPPTPTSTSTSPPPLALELEPADLRLSPGERGVIRLSASPQLKGLQVGPEGALRFDPKVLRVLSVRALSPFQLLAAKIDNARGWARFLLVSWAPSPDRKRPLLEVELEAVGDPGTEARLELVPDLLVDAQGREAKAQVRTGRVKIKPPALLRVTGLRLYDLAEAGYRFWIQGRGIDRIEVRIYDLRGRKVFKSGQVANGLIWRGRTREGRPVANGVYLYVVTVYGFRGEVLHMEVKKLIVLR